MCGITWVRKTLQKQSVICIVADIEKPIAAHSHRNEMLKMAKVFGRIEELSIKKRDDIKFKHFEPIGFNRIQSDSIGFNRIQSGNDRNGGRHPSTNFLPFGYSIAIQAK